MTTNEQRQHAIETIQAVAQFFIDHPEVPVPEFVSVSSYVADVETLERLAEHLGGRRIYGPDSRPQFDVRPEQPSPSLDTTAQVIVAMDPKRARKFV